MLNLAKEMYNQDEENRECTVGNKECCVFIYDVDIYLSLTLGTAKQQDYSCSLSKLYVVIHIF